MTAAAAPVRELTPAELDDWDAHAVDAPGGHVLQSRAWAGHRAASGWRPRFLVVGEQRALVLVRPWPLIGGASGYVPRGPVAPVVAWSFDGAEATPGAGHAIGGALAAVAAHLAADGVDVLAADPEVAEADAAYREVLAGAGFHAIGELQPSRHRMALRLDAVDEGAVFDGIAKATRQRIRRAERDRVVVVRHDAAPGDRDGFIRPIEASAVALDRFYGLLRATGDRLGFGFAGPADLGAWWQSALAAGHLVYLEGREGAADGDVLGGLVLFRHGRRLSTAHSADRTQRRRDHPGTMHLLRWRAIQLALAEGRLEMDLGGVDIAGARRVPLDGEPTYGLYEHKRAFGAAWVALAGAQERVARPWRYAGGRVLSRAARSLGQGRAAG